MNLLFVVVLFFFLTCFLNIIIHYKQLLLILLSVEALILLLLRLVFLTIIEFESLAYFRITIILSISVCEARLGLRLLVIISRMYGSDKISLVSISKC